MSMARATESGGVYSASTTLSKHGSGARHATRLSKAWLPGCEHYVEDVSVVRQPLHIAQHHIRQRVQHYSPSRSIRIASHRIACIASDYFEERPSIMAAVALV
ncbi:hypothetical protein AC579_1653 [Pseudocercospora musae]|uniref:Uncharacterized protein n=1 Tax=Pseudocercospora musae TaxID=113226 RepID=A0A139IAS2_9PEZI|nr:hypothetical protein AC579_1653 [Pseudocercospora musae]